MTKPVARPVTTPMVREQVKMSNGGMFKRPIAIKTNMLFDALTALNVELEIPVAPQWSISAEYIFPWWLNKSKQNCFELIAGTLEGKYWFNPNYSCQNPSLDKHNPLTGWYIGLNASIGYYDLEWHKKGHQGELWGVGISGGYAHAITRSLNLEYGLSVGYVNTHYRHYNAEKYNDGKWQLTKRNYGTYNWFGPTKLKVALVWYPYFKTKK
ncbi:MAG: DUF3575 domain-containing protein [Marinifilaceae bacterium]